MKVSIITVCYNDLQGLKITRNSISNQTYLDYEWIVVDGGSTDGSFEFIEGCTEITKFISEPDNGIYDAMNKGTLLAEGYYSVYLNAGDSFFNENSLAEVTKISKGEDLILSAAVFAYGNKTRLRKPRPLSSVWHSVPANHQAILFKTSIVKENIYDISYKICGDYELCARLFINGCTSLICPIPLVTFQLGGVSTVDINKLSSEAIKVQRNILKLSPIVIMLSKARRDISMVANLVLYKIFGVS